MSALPLMVMLLAGASCCPPVSAATMPDISAQIQAALSAGEHRVTLRPGIYHLNTSHPQRENLSLHNLNDLDIDASGVTLICTNLSAAVGIVNCCHLTLRGLTIDYDPLPSTQGTIVDLAPDRSWTDVKIHAGYPAPTVNAANSPQGEAFFWTVDNNDRQLKPGTVNRVVYDIIPRGNGVYRLDHGTLRFRDRADIGDYLRLPQKRDMDPGVFIQGGTNLALIGVTLRSAHFGFVIRNCHGLALQHVRIVPGPPPAGATEPRLSSTARDGINVCSVTGGLTIEDCALEATGDDGIAVYHVPGLVLRPPAGNHITVTFSPVGGALLKPGSRVRFYLGATGAVEEAAIVACAAASIPPDEITALRKQVIAAPDAHARAFTLELDVPVHAQPKDRLLVVDELAQPTVIRGNRLRNCCSRGIVANRSNVCVEDNQVARTFLPGIHVFAFFQAEGEAGFVDHAVLRNNRLESTGIGGNTQDGCLGAISVVSWDKGSDPFGGHHGIVIEENQITRSFGVDIQVHAATQVLIRGNRLVQSHLVKVPDGRPRKVDNGAFIYLQEVRGATVEGNEIIEPGPYANEQALNCVHVSGLSAARPFVAKTR